MAEIRVGERKVALEIYDTAGQEDFVQIRTLVYPGTDVFVMCYSVVFRPSLENITKFWYPETIKTQKACPFVLVGNKLDLATAPNMEYIKPEEAEMVVKRLDGYAALQCSAQQEAQGLSGNVDRVFKTAIKCGLENKVVPPEKEDGCKCIIL